MPAERLTPKMMAGIRWMAEHEPVALFPLDGFAPSTTIRRRLEQQELIEACGTEPGRVFGFTRYRLSEAGRALLKENADE